MYSGWKNKTIFMVFHFLFISCFQFQTCFSKLDSKPVEGLKRSILNEQSWWSLFPMNIIPYEKYILMSWTKFQFYSAWVNLSPAPFQSFPHYWSPSSRIKIFPRMLLLLIFNWNSCRCLVSSPRAHRLGIHWSLGDYRTWASSRSWADAFNAPTD